MSHKLGTESQQRGASPALSVRFDDDTHATVLELEDLTGQTKSELIRLFVDHCLDLLSTGRTEAMSRGMVQVWEILRENRKRVKRTEEGKRTERDDEEGGDLAVLRNQLAAITAKLESVLDNDQSSGVSS